MADHQAKALDSYVGSRGALPTFLLIPIPAQRLLTWDNRDGPWKAVTLCVGGFSVTTCALSPASRYEAASINNH